MADNEPLFCFCATYEQYLIHKRFQSEIIHMYIWRPNYFHVSVPFFQLSERDQRAVIHNVEWYLASLDILCYANQIR